MYIWTHDVYDICMCDVYNMIMATIWFLTSKIEDSLFFS